MNIEYFEHTIKKPNKIGMNLLGFNNIPNSNEYHYELLKYLSKNNELYDLITQFSKEFQKTELFNSFLKYILNKFDFESIYKKIKTNEFWALSAYFRNCLNFCPQCGKPTLRKFCSSKCSNSSLEVQKLKEKSYIEKYGFSNPMFSNEIKEKLKNNNFEKYGFKYIFQIPFIKNKIKKTNIEKYGSEFPQTTNEIKEKTKQTNIKKYGKEWFTQTDEYLNKTKQTNIEKYGVENISYIPEIIEKIKKSQFETFGHINYENFNEKFIKENFIEKHKFKIKEFMNYFHYYDRCSINKLKVSLNIKEPNNDWNLNNGHSKAELELFNWIPLNNKISGDRTLIAPLELDILLPDLKLAIEYNGSYWHSFKSINYHINKLNMCNEKGYELWFIYDYDNLNFWKQRILDKINNKERKFDIKGIIDARLYSKNELINPIIQYIKPTENFILGNYIC